MNERVRNAISDPDVTFFLIPTPTICQYIIQGEHPYVKALSDVVKSGLLEGKVFPVESSMVLDFIEGKLDAKNHFLLSNCELRVRGAKDVVVESPKGVSTADMK